MIREEGWVRCRIEDRMVSIRTVGFCERGRLAVLVEDRDPSPLVGEDHRPRYVGGAVRVRGLVVQPCRSSVGVLARCDRALSRTS